jgi:hypothetical protein
MRCYLEGLSLRVLVRTAGGGLGLKHRFVSSISISRREVVLIDIDTDCVVDSEQH